MGNWSHDGHMIEAWKKRIRECRARAAELREKAEASDPKDLMALRDAETWERMAEWEERNPPPPN